MVVRSNCDLRSGSEAATAPTPVQTLRKRASRRARTGLRPPISPRVAEVRTGKAWAGRIHGEGGVEAYVFSRHEDGTAPRFVLRLMEIAGV